MTQTKPANQAARLLAYAMLGAAAASAIAFAAMAPAAAPAATFSQQIPQVRPGPGDPCNMGVLDQQILLKPSDVNSLLTRAYCYLNTSPGPNRKPPVGDVMRAMTDLETVLTIDPKNFYAHHDYAQVAYLLGYYDFAVTEYTKAVALNPQDARGYLGRGWAHSYLCQMNDATADFVQAARLDPSLAPEVESRQAMAQQRAHCARPAAPPQATRNCPPKQITAFSLSARIVLEDEWRHQHPGCP